ncbi:hypothetical protein GE09DRAFT_1091080 [Coniochaeta sp. 2T2.1]|nr:hypothetical protein GE09DRAFT_1091080 [Coniochaeta sp. 2T2.1]
MLCYNMPIGILGGWLLMTHCVAYASIETRNRARSPAPVTRGSSHNYFYHVAFTEVEEIIGSIDIRRRSWHCLRSLRPVRHGSHHRSLYQRLWFSQISSVSLLLGDPNKLASYEKITLAPIWPCTQGSRPDQGIVRTLKDTNTED